MKEVTKEYIQALNYTDFISFLKETNRCPGGKRSVREISINTFIGNESKILDVGSNTGFNSLEFAHITKAKVFGIDISKSCVEEARQLLEQDSPDVRERVEFNVGSAYDIPFEDEHFDLVLCNGATSFMDDKDRAVEEYYRVLKPWGFLAATQLFYDKQPPQRLLRDVSEILGVKIDYLTKDQWLNILNANKKRELYYFKEYKFEHRSVSDVEQYVLTFLEKDHIASLDNEVKQEIYNKWLKIMSVFSENNDYLSFFIAIYRKNTYPEEKELFI